MNTWENVYFWGRSLCFWTAKKKKRVISIFSRILVPNFWKRTSNEYLSLATWLWSLVLRQTIWRGQFYIFECFSKRSCSLKSELVGNKNRNEAGVPWVGVQNFMSWPFSERSLLLLFVKNTFPWSSTTKFRQLEGIMRIQAMCRVNGRNWWRMLSSQSSIGRMMKRNK